MAIAPDLRVTSAKTSFSSAGRRTVSRLARLTQQFRPDRDQAQSRFLEPVFVRLQWGRVGSTLLMQLLATSSDISFDRVYPFEHLCLASLLHYLEPFSRVVEVPDQSEWIDDPDTIWWAAPQSFGFRISGTALGYTGLGIERDALHREAVRSLWQAYSDLAPWPGDSRPRFYAEKYGGGAEWLSAAGIAYRTIDLVRDPRDTWCSVLAFDAKRGYYGFGRREGQSEEEYLSSFLRAVKRRMDAMAATNSDVPVMVVRYEDLMTDLGKVAMRVGLWLGVQLDSRAALRATEDYGQHKTIDRAEESINRWREEVSPEVNARFVDELGDHLDRYGYPQQ